MSQCCKCDICGKITYLDPPRELEYEEVSVEGSDQKIKKLKTAQIKRENPVTKKMEVVEIPKHKDLKPRAYIIQLHVGMSETIKRDFCFDCLQKVKPEILKAWDFLEGIQPK